MPGGSLADRLSKCKRLSVEESVSIAGQVAAVLEVAHRHGVIHRDIKPDNILFVRGIPKLGDLGLLSSLSMTMSTLAGTYEFIPPEIRSSDNFNNYDNVSRQKCDLYAFGKVIYCIITGMDPLSFPSLPKNLSTSLPVKYFLRLSWELCSPDPARRLDNADDVENAIERIEYKLLYGEHWMDKFFYALHQSQQNDQSIVTELLHIKPSTWSVFASILTVIILSTVLPHEYRQVLSVNYSIFMTFFFLFSWLCFYIVIDIMIKVMRLFRSGRD